MRPTLVDIRCLQDPNYAERGIGRHAAALLAHVRTMLPDARLIGLADRKLPEATAQVRGVFDEVRHHAYTGALTTPSCHVQLSAMTHDPLFTARLLHHPAIPSATAVYDFIPFDEPGRYLGHPGARIDYQVALRWLARYQLYLPISQDAAGRLRSLLHVPDERIVVTGAPLHPMFESLPAERGRHILVVGGADERKNPGVAVRAHARNETCQRRGIPLVITGAYSPGWLDAQRRMAKALGGDPGLVIAPGHVNEPALRRLFAGALCVVAPSRQEGFSLPVIEAMAAGIPVLASAIPAHRELVDGALFEPDDDGMLQTLLGRALDPEWRRAALAWQGRVWPRFRAAAVAERFWNGVARLIPAQAPARIGRKARVAFLTPLPPARSGVAEFSAATCPPLGARVELHVLTPTRDAQAPAHSASCSTLCTWPSLSSAFDRVVHVLGNSVFHLDILHQFLRHGGAAIVHDGRMLDLYAAHISMPKTCRMAEAEMGRPLRNNEIWHWLAGDTPPQAMIMAEIAEAEPLMLHSRSAVSEIARRYGRPATHLPFALYRQLPPEMLTPAAKRAARERLGIEAGEVLVATFGSVHPTKAPLDCVWTLDVLRSWNIRARLHFVGGPLMDMAPLVRTIAELGLDEHVRLGGAFLDETSYSDHLVAADVAVQLRVAGIGSVSGALADCISAGLPTVASLTLADALDVPDFVRAVPDNPSPILIAEGIMDLLAGGSTAEARKAYVGAHSFEAYADHLCRALSLS